MGAEKDLNAYGKPLTTASYFKYLGRVMLDSDGDCPEVV